MVLNHLPISPSRQCHRYRPAPKQWDGVERRFPVAKSAVLVCVVRNKIGALPTREVNHARFD